MDNTPPPSNNSTPLRPSQPEDKPSRPTARRPVSPTPASSSSDGMDVDSAPTRAARLDGKDEVADDDDDDEDEDDQDGEDDRDQGDDDAIVTASKSSASPPQRSAGLVGDPLDDDEDPIYRPSGGPSYDDDDEPIDEVEGKKAGAEGTSNAETIQGGTVGDGGLSSASKSSRKKQKGKAVAGKMEARGKDTELYDNHIVAGWHQDFGDVVVAYDKARS